MTGQDNKFKFHCPHPWFGMAVSYSGNVSVDCCDYGFSGMLWNPASPLDIVAHWNNPWYQNLRKIFQGKSLTGSGCEWCRKGDQLFRPHDPSFPKGMNSLQEMNFKKALESYHDREPRVGHYPVDYLFDFGRQCNLDCCMCNQADVRKTNPGGQLSADALLAQIDILRHANSAYFFGGEPLLIGESRKMLHHLIEHPKLREIELRLITNGVLLGDFAKKMLPKDRLILTVSMDSWGDAYEAIRCGASWKNVSASVDRFLDLKVKHGKEDWKILISAVFMKTALKRLPEFIEWCLARGLAPGFSDLISTRHTENEDVLRHPELLSEIPDWADKLDQAIAMLERSTFTGTAATLKQYRKALYGAAAQNISQASPIDKDTSLMRLNTNDIRGKTVVIWGTGSNYRGSIAPWLKLNRNFVKFLGFVDNNITMHGGIVDDAYVYPPSMLKAFGRVDVLIVASVRRPQIINQLKGMNLNVGCVI